MNGAKDAFDPDIAKIFFACRSGTATMMDGPFEVVFVFDV